MLRAAEAPDLPLAANLQADGRVARRRRIPFVVLFSLARCPYCSEVRRAHLLPMLRDPAQAQLAVIRQINIGSDERIIDFDGNPTTHDALATRYGHRAAPVVAFWDPRGKPVAEEIRGMPLADFYASYLESALATARASVSATG